jgi:hypothetical protein
MYMKSLLLRILAATMVLVAGAGTVHAEIEVWLSVKFILRPDGTRPTGSGVDISTVSGFRSEVNWGNQAMARVGRGFRLRVVEYLDIQPPVPSGQPTDYWYNLPTRDERQTIETAALADQTTWRWHTGAINIYVNNSSSGSCSFVNGGSSIALGGTLFSSGTVIHEIGHFFNLSHTHAGDPACPVAAGTATPVADGDTLPETIPDHNCLTRDQLSQSNFTGRVYAALTPAEQTQVNSSWLNVMSYHQAEILLPDQMDRWTTNANTARLFACLGQTWFVAPFGSDANSGTLPGTPFATIARAQASIELPNDVILLRSGVYNAPAARLNVPATYCATRGPVFITAP